MNAYDTQVSAVMDDVDHVARVLELIAMHAPSREPVLFLGPRNLGANFLAEALHACSPRHDRPYVRARCGLYSGMLLDAQLFGRSNVRNGYLRATMSRRKGMVGTADGGSFFVEQIQNTTPGVQAKLLELITEGEYTDFEQTATYVADVRLIASARPSLEHRVKSGLFLPQLWAQLRPACIELDGSCASQEGILAVIDRLRAEVMLQTAGGIGRVTECWTMAERSAKPTHASTALRRAVEFATQQCPSSVPIEAVFLVALRYMSRDLAESRDVEPARLSGGLFGRNGRYLHARATGHAYCLVPDISQSSPVMSLVVR